MVDAGGVPGLDISVRNQLKLIRVVRFVAATTAAAFPLHNSKGQRHVFEINILPGNPNGFSLADATVLEVEEHKHWDLKSKRDNREQTRGASGVIIREEFVVEHAMDQLAVLNKGLDVL